MSVHIVLGQPARSATAKLNITRTVLSRLLLSSFLSVVAVVDDVVVVVVDVVVVVVVVVFSLLLLLCNTLCQRDDTSGVPRDLGSNYGPIDSNYGHIGSNYGPK